MPWRRLGERWRSIGNQIGKSVGGLILYSISGTVYDADGTTAVSGATVTLGAISDVSAGDGTYTLTGVAPGASGSMTCVKTGYSWVSKTISAMNGNLTSQDYTAWSPLVLGSNLVFWGDPRQMTGLSDDDAASQMTDYSGNNRHASNKVGTVTYKIASDLPFIRFASDGGLATDAFAWGSDAVSLFVVAALASGGTKMIAEFGATGGNEVGGWSLYKSSANYLQAFSNGCLYNMNGRAIAASVPTLLEMIANKSLSTDEATGYVNGMTFTGVRSPNTNTSDSFGTKQLFIGSRNNASLFSSGDIYQVVAVKSAMSDEDRFLLETYLSDNFNLGFIGFVDTMDGNVMPYSLMSNAREYVYTSPEASIKYETDATEVTIDSYSTQASISTAYAKLGVLVNGTPVDPVAHTADNYKQTTISLGAGAGKTVHIVNGYRNNFFNGGTYANKIAFNAAATRQTLPSTPRLYFWGDSILSGRSATNPASGSVVPGLLSSFIGAIYNDAYDGRRLIDDCADASARTAFAAKVAGFAPTIIWLQMGTNDYSGSTISAADFQTAYADLLDKLNAQLPSAVIYAQTMIIRTVETANSFGDTTDDYRTAISNAQSTRSSFCTLVNGKTIMTTGELADAVHPNDAGFALYIAAVKTALGLS